MNPEVMMVTAEPVERKVEIDVKVVAVTLWLGVTVTVEVGVTVVVEDGVGVTVLVKVGVTVMVEVELVLLMLVRLIEAEVVNGPPQMIMVVQAAH